MKKLIVSGVALAVVAGFASYWLLVRTEPAGAPVSDKNESSVTDNSSKVSEPAEPAPPTEETTLAAVGAYRGDGQATRTTEGEYIHTVTASLDDPADGKFYEGWIVVDAENFISTGKLTQEAPGQWSLTYRSERDLASYSTVVITEETEANGLDNVPEAHVLEGSF